MDYHKKIDIKFSSTTDLLDVTVERFVNTLVFAPETAAIGQPIRVFVQTTSDGLLIGGPPSELLGTTHVHLPSGLSVTLTNAFKTLHQGLYYVDYIPVEEGTHVFHVVAFSQGTTSHGSSATTVLSQDLGGISLGTSGLIFIYDGAIGGSGASKALYDRFEKVLERSMHIVKECPCKNEAGCPRCTFSYRCGNNNEFLHKYSALEILERINNGEKTELIDPVDGDKPLV